jgi:hypothetical protein
MSKWGLSAEIERVLAANPKAARQRRHIDEARRRKMVKAEAAENARLIARFGAEALVEVQCWNEFAERTGFMLAIFRRRKDIIVDVLQVSEAMLDDRRGLVLHVVEPHRTRDKIDVGESVNLIEWEDEFELKRSELVYFEPLSVDFDGQCVEDGYPEYHRVVKRGLTIARQMRAQGKL